MTDHSPRASVPSALALVEQLREKIVAFKDGTQVRSRPRGNGPGKHRYAAEVREVETIQKTLNVVLAELDQLAASLAVVPSQETTTDEPSRASAPSDAGSDRISAIPPDVVRAVARTLNCDCMICCACEEELEQATGLKATDNYDWRPISRTPMPVIYSAEINERVKKADADRDWWKAIVLNPPTCHSSPMKLRAATDDRASWGCLTCGSVDELARESAGSTPRVPRSDGSQATGSAPDPSSAVAVVGEATPQLEAAFRAGYHCRWHRDIGRYNFDPAMAPGDPEGAFAAWLEWLASSSVSPQPPEPTKNDDDV
jgi:hypothetical protein